MRKEHVGKIPVSEWRTVSFPIQLAWITTGEFRSEYLWHFRAACPDFFRRPGGLACLGSLRRFGGVILLLTIFLLVQHTDAVNVPPLWRWSNPSPHGANIVDQAANSALTVQVGERGQIYLSDDWETWLPRDTFTAAALRGATFFNGRLVITGEAGTVIFADDPWNFHGLTLGTSDWLESVAASSNLLVAVGDNAAI